jgi:hypothetical protein
MGDSPCKMEEMRTYIYRVTDAEGGELGTIDTFAHMDDPTGAELDARREAKKKWGDDQTHKLELLGVRAGMDI